MPQAPPISSGLRTTFRSGVPPVLHVDWIAWDSGFRGSALRVGDQITAVEGQALAGDMAPSARSLLPGQDQEQAAWAARGLASGAALQLRVRRRQVPGEGWQWLDVQGSLNAEAQHRNSNGQATLGPGGPPRLQRDGFVDPWAAWYDKRVFDWERQLDGGVWLRGGDSRAELARHLEAEPRVRHLAAQHPGAFAQAVEADWQAVQTSLAGRRYDIAPAEYAYRAVDAALQARVTATATAAWQALLEEHCAAIIKAPAVLDPVAGDKKAYAGKLLVLPPPAPMPG